MWQSCDRLNVGLQLERHCFEASNYWCRFKSQNHYRPFLVLIMASEAQLALDPAGRLQFSWGSCDQGSRRDLAQAGGVRTEGLGRCKGMMDGPPGECQNHKSNLSLTPSSYKVYLHFHVASTSKTSMFRCFKGAWHAHLSCHRAFTEDRKWDQFIPLWPNWVSAHILPCSRISPKIFYRSQVCLGSFYLYYYAAAITACLQSCEVVWGI